MKKVLLFHCLTLASLLFVYDRKTNKIRKAIIRANNAIASVRAKPKMA